MRSRVAAGSGSPKRSAAPRPAIASIQATFAPAACTTACIATVTSRPMPSPAIKTTGVAKRPLPGAIGSFQQTAETIGVCQALEQRSGYAEYRDRANFAVHKAIFFFLERQWRLEAEPLQCCN